MYLKAGSHRAIVAMLIGTSAAGAQTVASSRQFAPSELRRVVEALAHDSMLGRPTASPALETATQYVAEQFRAAGLEPLGDDSSYFQRYPVLETVLDPETAWIEVDSLAPWHFGTDFYYAAGAGGDPSGVQEGPVVIVTGTVTRESAPALGVSRKVVVFISPLDEAGRPADFRSVFALLSVAPIAVIVPGARPDSLWLRLGRDPDEHMPSVEAAWPVWTAGPLREGRVRFIPVLELWRGRFDQFFRQVRVDSIGLYAPGGAAKVTPVDVNATLRFGRRVERVAWPANVVAMLPGSDPVLRHQYVVLTAHLDGLGQVKGGPPGPEGVLNGADDNASGVAAIIQVAKAFASAPHRSKRSLIFAAVSGEERGLWGSDYLASRSPVHHDQVVANVNLDMVGRARGDTVYFIGRSDPFIGPLVASVVRRASSRGLLILDQDALERRFPGEELADRSDAVNFARRGVPTVWLFTGLHEDYHETTDDADKLNYDALGRISQLVSDITKAIADASAATHRP